MKNSYTVAIGNKEIANNSVSFCKLGINKQNSMENNEFIQMIKNQINHDKQL